MRMVAITLFRVIGGRVFDKNMFYTTVQPETLLERCEETLGVNHDFADITYFAADHRFSYNHTIWSNDPEVQSNRISKVIAFGDSLPIRATFSMPHSGASPTLTHGS